MNLILNEDDLPSQEELLQGVTRLRKCAELLKTMRSNKRKDEDPDALKRIANFLEMIAKKDIK